ncbi:conserved hypothetical protein [Aggregatibacter segnis ATCC 33393]|uniref:Uncharacterized protein n=2 Tax=Aggregatibacter segnis TaxID=739 RepID=E6KV79_9PAST|nr:conserved hypothetical protein [Aggregatibacter segnis ATCC 33393]SQH64051.1 Uncharacterised protein [Aggregatibacter segnis ATCC 33393]
MFTYRESYTIDKMAYWEHRESKVKASAELKNKCFEKIHQIAPASTLVLFNKNIANFTHKRWENQCSKSFGFCDRTFS